MGGSRRLLTFDPDAGLDDLLARAGWSITTPLLVWDEELGRLVPLEVEETLEPDSRDVTPDPFATVADGPFMWFRDFIVFAAFMLLVMLGIGGGLALAVTWGAK